MGWAWQSKLDQSALVTTLFEWGAEPGDEGRVRHRTRVELPSAIAPHDFAVTPSYYVFQLNAAVRPARANAQRLMTNDE